MSAYALILALQYAGLLPDWVRWANSQHVSVFETVGPLVCIILLFVGLAWWLWIKAEAFSGPAAEANLTVNDVGFDDLRRLAFSLLGAYLALTSFGSILLYMQANPFMSQSLVGLVVQAVYRHGLMFLIGLGLFFFNRPRRGASFRDLANWPRKDADTTVDE